MSTFYKNKKMVSNKYFTFDRVIDDDNIVIVTSNVRFFNKNNSFVLFVDNNKILYLQDWLIRPVRNYRADIMEAWAVKLNRNYFKTYTLKNDSNDLSFEKEDTFDELYKVAVDQQEENMSFSSRKLY